MDIHKFFYTRWANIIGLSLTGMGIGWLVGLSVSPVVSIVITSIVGSAAAIVAVLSGIQYDQEKTENSANRFLIRGKVTLLPLTILVIGICIGAIFGILCRNEHWLGSTISSEIKAWSDQGLAKSSITNRLFDRQYPDSSSIPVPINLTDTISVWTNVGISQTEVIKGLFEYTYGQRSQLQGISSNSTNQAQHGSILFGISSSECNSLYAALAESDESLKSALDSSTQTALRNLTSVIHDPATLREIVERVLCFAD